MQKIYPSIHLLEVFMPVVDDEPFFVNEVVSRIPDIPFYKGIETGVIHEAGLRRKVREVKEANGYQLTVWLSPDLNDNGFNLSAIDKDLRTKSVKKAIELIDMAAEMGADHCGIPCGPYPGDALCDEAKKVLTDSYIQMLDHVESIPDIDLTFEPLDRYAHKKMLLGPIAEVIEVFREVRKHSNRIFIHWDSAHETLAGIDLHESLSMALPYLAQIHLCNCVSDKSHPYYGDWHMSLGQAPDYKNWGYLDLNVAVDILKTLSGADRAEGVDRTFCAVEVRNYKGNDLWASEALVRSFMKDAFTKAGIDFEE